MAHRNEREQLLAEAVRLYNAGSRAESLSTFEQCFSLFAETERSSVEFANFCGNYGSALAETGDFKLAEWLFNSALQIYGANGKTSDVARIHFNLGNVYRYINSRQRCFDSYKKALETYRSCNDEVGEALSLLQLTHHFVTLGVFDLAREWLEQVDELDESVKQDPTVHWAWCFQQAKFALHDNQPEQALILLEQALTSAHKMGDSAYIEETMGAIAELRIRLGQTEDALTHLERAYEVARTRKDRRLLSHTYALAQVLAERGELERAEMLYEECLTLMDLTRGRIDGAERFHWMEQLSSISREFCAMLYKHGRHMQSLEVSERGQGRVILDLMFRHQIKLQSGRSVRAAGNGRVILDAPNITEILAKLHETNTHVFKLLETGGQILAWFVSPDGSVEAWKANSSLAAVSDMIGLLLLSGATTPQVDMSKVQEVRAQQPGMFIQWNEFKKTLSALYEALFPVHVRERLENSRGRLLIVPHQSFFHVPWTVLGPLDGPPLGTNWEIAVVPSVGVFMQLDRLRDPTPWRGLEGFQIPVVAVGDCGPQTVEIPIVSAPDAPKIQLSFCELPGTREEVLRVSELLNGIALVGPDAHVAAVRAISTITGVVHFATHGYWLPMSDMSFLLLAPSPAAQPGSLFATGEPGTLLVAQVMDDSYRIHSELVTLSGCQTGLGASHPDTYINLAHSFLIAGARSVLVSLWPIRDDATVAFMEEFYLELQGGCSPAEALQRAQEQMQKSALYSEAWNWSGFVLVGNPFHAFDAEVESRQLGGPAFCGGDVLWLDAEDGTKFPMENFQNEYQTNNEAWIVSSGKLITRLNKY